MDNEPTEIIVYEGGVTLLGGGALDAADFARARALTVGLVAADGGGDRALALGATPDRVIGDMDSLSAEGRARLADRILRVAEQESTDFGKCLRCVRADFYLCLGFAGLRLDHTLAALSEIARNAGRRALVVAEDDVAFRAPDVFAARLPAGERLSIFPMGETRGESVGLRWPIDGLTLTPAGRIGTSNEVSGVAGTLTEVRITLRGPALILTPKRNLETVLNALGARPAVRGE